MASSTGNVNFRVPVKFVGDNDIFDNIVNIDAKYGAKKVKEIVGNKNTNEKLSTKKEIKRFDSKPTDSSSIDDCTKAANLNSSDSESEDSQEKSTIQVRSSIRDLMDQCLKSQSTSKFPTSDHTLNKIKRVDFNYDSLHELLKKSVDHHVSEKKVLAAEHESCFGKWQILLSEGFNILLYGVGSKFKILNSFHQKIIPDENAIVVHGFFTGLSLKTIFNIITEELLDHSGHFSSVDKQAEFISSKFNESDKLFVIIHNLDVAAIRDVKFIPLLCQLAKSKGIHIVASVDHVNSSLLWDNSRNCIFKWLWFETNTFATYDIETSYEDSLLMQQGKTLALSSLRHVFRSLTPNAQGIFMLLAKHQLEHDKEANYLGISFPDLFHQCREAFLVNSDLALRTQLIEFKDHNMLRSRKALDGIEYLQVPINSGTLQQFIDQQEE